MGSDGVGRLCAPAEIVMVFSHMLFGTLAEILGCPLVGGYMTMDWFCLKCRIAVSLFDRGFIKQYWIDHEGRKVYW